MSKIENLKAVAEDYEIPVTDLIDFCTGYPASLEIPEAVELSEILTSRIQASEKLGLSEDYVNGLKDALKLTAPSPDKESNE